MGNASSKNSSKLCPCPESKSSSESAPESASESVPESAPPSAPESAPPSAPESVPESVPESGSAPVPESTTEPESTGPPPGFRGPGSNATVKPPANTGTNILYYVTSKNVDELNKLLDKWSGNEEALNWGNSIEGTTAFLAACGTNCIECLKSLLNTSGVDVNLADKTGYTGLFWAVIKGNIDIIKELLDKKDFTKLDLDKSPIKGQYAGWTPLKVANFLASPNKKDFASIAIMLEDAGATKTPSNPVTKGGKGKSKHLRRKRSKKTRKNRKRKL